MSVQIDRVLRGVPLRTRLLVSSLLGTVPLILLGLLLLVSRYQARRNLILQGNETLAQVAAESTQGWLEGNIRTLRTLARSNEVRSGNRAAIQGLVDRQAAAQPDWENLNIANAEGQMIAGKMQPLVSVREREYFKEVRRTGEPAVSDLVVSYISGRPIVVISVPVIFDGQFRGSVQAAVRPESIQALFFMQAMPERPTTIAVWGSDLRLIASTSAEERATELQDGDNTLAPYLGDPSGVFIARSPSNGERILYGFAHVPSADWVVTAGTPFDLAMGPITRDTGIFLALVALVLALTLWWTFYSANTVSRQVSRLADYARAIGEGRYPEPIAAQTGDELEDLAVSLNQMSADLATLDRLKSDLITMVSHELKTPLTSILASLELLTSGILQPDQPEFREALEIAERQAHQLQTLIEHLIDVARLQAGGLTVTPLPVPLAPIVRAAVQQHESNARGRGLALLMEVPDDLDVMADAPKATLALSNLIDNAIKFTPRGSVTVHARREGREAVVTVTDTGVGLTDEARQALFRRFSQGEPLLTRRAGGVGLGLWMVRAIVEAHGGRVFAESEGPGRGSTFGFTLPLAPEV